MQLLRGDIEKQKLADLEGKVLVYSKVFDEDVIRQMGLQPIFCCYATNDISDFVEKQRLPQAQGQSSGTAQHATNGLPLTVFLQLLTYKSELDFIENTDRYFVGDYSQMQKSSDALKIGVAAYYSVYVKQRALCKAQSYTEIKRLPGMLKDHLLVNYVTPLTQASSASHSQLLERKLRTFLCGKFSKDIDELLKTIEHPNPARLNLLLAKIDAIYREDYEIAGQIHSQLNF